MNLALKPELKRLIEQRLQSGQYASAEDVVEAGLMALEQQEAYGDFEAGELNELLAEGERSQRRKRVVGAREVFGELRRKSEQRRRRG